MEDNLIRKEDDQADIISSQDAIPKDSNELKVITYDEAMEYTGGKSKV